MASSLFYIALILRNTSSTISCYWSRGSNQTQFGQFTQGQLQSIDSDYDQRIQTPTLAQKLEGAIKKRRQVNH